MQRSGNPSDSFRVLLVTPTLGRDGGVATHVTASARALAGRGHKVHIVAHALTAAPPPGVTASQIEGIGEAHPSQQAVAGLLAACEKQLPDVVHLHDVAPLRIAEGFGGRFPLVSSAHGYSCCSPNTYYFEPGNECTRPHGPGCVPHMLFRGCAHSRDPRSIPARYRETTRRRKGLAQVDAVVGYSHAMMRHLERNRLEGLRHVRLFSETAPAPSPVPGARQLLFVGRVTPAKGLDVLLRALVDLDAQLDVHGDGWWLPKAKHLALELGVMERVRFAGWSTPEALAHAYRRARAVVVPSLWPEPFGLVGLEAMAFQRPVVGSATGGIPDWLQHERTGLLVPAGDASALSQALSLVLDKNGPADAMAARGLDMVRRHFTADGHVDDLAAVYRFAIDRPAQRRVVAQSGA